eukprot:UN24687
MIFLSISDISFKTEIKYESSFFVKKTVFIIMHESSKNQPRFRCSEFSQFAGFRCFLSLNPEAIHF